MLDFLCEEKMEKDKLIMLEFQLKLKLNELKIRKQKMRTQLEGQAEVSKEDKMKWKALKQVYRKTKDEYNIVLSQLKEYENSEDTNEIQSN